MRRIARDDEDAAVGKAPRYVAGKMLRLLAARPVARKAQHQEERRSREQPGEASRVWESRASAWSN